MIRIMRWGNFTHVWHTEGWKQGTKIAVWGWITTPWKAIRIRIAKAILHLLRVEGYFDE